MDHTLRQDDLSQLTQQELGTHENKVEAIEKDVEALSPDQLAAFRRWFHEFDAVVWDRQLEEDVRAGKLDALADEALQAYKSGKCTEL